VTAQLHSLSMSTTRTHIVVTNSLENVVLEDLMKVHEVIALKHVGTMLTLIKM